LLNEEVEVALQFLLCLHEEVSDLSFFPTYVRPRTESTIVNTSASIMYFNEDGFLTLPR